MIVLTSPIGDGLPGIDGKRKLRLVHERAVGEPGIDRWRHLATLGHPFDRRRRECREDLARGHRVRRQHAGAERAPGRGGRQRERAVAAAVRRARHVVATHFRRQRNVDVGLGADVTGRHAQIPEFGRREDLRDLRTGAARSAAIEHARRRPAARGVGVGFPPQHRVRALLVELAFAARDREAIVDRILAGGDERNRAVPDRAGG